uniref:Hydrogenase maturation factor hoxX. Methionyl-tRNA formyltransferase n=1 Tax=Magnetococcus massalia (strain MO-1) TaxID=451514 RepID=A0A1S7LC84_MAGMO|nr:Hydrogenase maturation factor hoxX. Methionyl-tRNA formyltransferase [Candidatus Magnetococcus massalia]
MRILFLTHAFNSLTQALYIALGEGGHDVTVEFDINDEVTREAVALAKPDLIVAPFLKRAIPEEIWRRYLCLIVHPGIMGDRGPSSLDWAVLEGEKEWGVTVLKANAEMDAGDILASRTFPMRNTTKASLYRHEVTDAACECILEVVDGFEKGRLTPRPLDDADDDIHGRLRPLMQQSDRAIDWEHDGADTIVRKIRCADGFPGVRDNLFGRDFFLYDGHKEESFCGAPGTIIARCGPAICLGTGDGAVWVGHLREPHGAMPFKLPATQLLAQEVDGLPELSIESCSGYREIWYEQECGIGYLHFPFYNGAMGTHQCQRLLAAYREACQRDTRVIVLMGGQDFWSNGMHLNLIEAAGSAADASWENINAMDDLTEAIINTRSHLTVAALQGNAGAGGVFLARACDQVWLRRGVILNPYYKDMGNLYGSEYWTYLLPLYAGEASVKRITQSRLPMGSAEAVKLGLADAVLPSEQHAFCQQVSCCAESLAQVRGFAQLLVDKQARRERDEAAKPLAAYRQEELAFMQRNFNGFDPSYHVARYNFVHKVPKSRTPLTIAAHRRISDIIQEKAS